MNNAPNQLEVTLDKIQNTTTGASTNPKNLDFNKDLDFFDPTNLDYNFGFGSKALSFTF